MDREDACKDKDKQMDKLESEINELNDQISKLKSYIMKEQTKKIDDIEERLKENGSESILGKVKGYFENFFNAISKEFKEVDSKIQESDSKLNKVDEKLQKSSAKLKGVRDGLELTDARVQNLEFGTKDIKNGIENTVNRLSNLETAISKNHTADMKYLEDSCESLRSKYEKINSENITLERSISAKDEESRNLYSIISQKDDSIKKYDDYYNYFKDVSAKKDNQIESLNDQVNRLNSKSEKQEEAINNLSLEVLSKKEEIKQLNQDIINYKGIIFDAERNIMELESVIETKEFKISDLSSTIAKKESIIESLESSVSETSGNLKSIQGKFAGFDDLAKPYVELGLAIKNCDSIKNLLSHVESLSNTADIIKFISIVGNEFKFAIDIYTEMKKSKSISKMPIDDSEKNVIELINNFYKSSKNIEYDILVIPNFPDNKFNKVYLKDFDKPAATDFKFFECVYVPVVMKDEKNAAFHAVVKGIR